jgi:hypothetical protein
VKGEGAGLHATAPCGSGEVVDVDHLLFDIGKLCARSLLFHPPQFLQLEELDLKEEQGLTWVSSVRCRPKVVRARLGAARTVWVWQIWGNVNDRVRTRACVLHLRPGGEGTIAGE